MKFSKKTLLASLALTSFYVVQVNGARDVCQSSYHDNRLDIVLGYCNFTTPPTRINFIITFGT